LVNAELQTSFPCGPHGCCFSVSCSRNCVGCSTCLRGSISVLGGQGCSSNCCRSGRSRQVPGLETGVRSPYRRGLRWRFFARVWSQEHDLSQPDFAREEQATSHCGFDLRLTLFLHPCPQPASRPCETAPFAAHNHSQNDLTQHLRVACDSAVQSAVRLPVHLSIDPPSQLSDDLPVEPVTNP
jgi:hypothetical protein